MNSITVDTRLPIDYVDLYKIVIFVDIINDTTFIGGYTTLDDNIIYKLLIVNNSLIVSDSILLRVRLTEDITQLVICNQKYQITSYYINQLLPNKIIVDRKYIEHMTKTINNRNVGKSLIKNIVVSNIGSVDSIIRIYDTHHNILDVDMVYLIIEHDIPSIYVTVHDNNDGTIFLLKRINNVLMVDTSMRKILKEIDNIRNVIIIEYELYELSDLISLYKDKIDTHIINSMG